MLIVLVIANPVLVTIIPHILVPVNMNVKNKQALVAILCAFAKEGVLVMKSAIVKDMVIGNVGTMIVVTDIVGHIHGVIHIVLLFKLAPLIVLVTMFVVACSFKGF